MNHILLERHNLHEISHIGSMVMHNGTAFRGQLDRNSFNQGTNNRYMITKTGTYLIDTYEDKFEDLNFYINDAKVNPMIGSRIVLLFASHPNRIEHIKLVNGDPAGSPRIGIFYIPNSNPNPNQGGSQLPIVLLDRNYANDGNDVLGPNLESMGLSLANIKNSLEFVCAMSTYNGTNTPEPNPRMVWFCFSN